MDRASLAASVGARMYVGSSEFYKTDASHDMARIYEGPTLTLFPVVDMGGFSILTVVSQLRYEG